MQKTTARQRLTAVLIREFNIRLGGFLFVNIWTAPIVFLAVYGGYFTEFAAAYSVALIHELAHVICAGFFGVGVSHITLYPFGLCAVLSDGYIPSSYKEFFTALAGPLSNAVMFFICSVLYNLQNAAFLLLCMNINLAMCVLNLVPALPLDGGRMLKAILSSQFGIIRSYNFMLRVSRVLVLMLFAAAAAVFFLNKFNFSLILISAFLLQNLCSEQRSLTIVTVREILNRKSAYGEEMREYRSKPLCAAADAPARGILKHISFDCVHIVHVTDKSGKITAVLTETQVLDALCRDGIRIRYGDIAA